MCSPSSSAVWTLYIHPDLRHFHRLVGTPLLLSHSLGEQGTFHICGSLPPFAMPVREFGVQNLIYFLLSVRLLDPFDERVGTGHHGPHIPGYGYVPANVLQSKFNCPMSISISIYLYLSISIYLYVYISIYLCAFVVSQAMDIIELTHV